MLVLVFRSTSSSIRPSSLQLQVNTIEDHLDWKFETDLDEMNAMDDVKEHIWDMENLFNQGRPESMEIGIGNAGPAWDDDTHDRKVAKGGGKEGMWTSAAGAVKEGDAKIDEEVSWVCQCGSLSAVSLVFLGISCISSYPECVYLIWIVFKLIHV